MSLVGNFGANDNRGAESAKDGVSSVVTREEEVHQLARRFTEQSTYSTTVQNPFAADPGSALDPNGDNFNARAWCKAMLRMHTEDNQAHPLRTLGVAFSNLNVHGFSSDADYQKSVGNVWLETLSLARKFISQRQRKIKILQSLDGLVEAGEMLAGDAGPAIAWIGVSGVGLMGGKLVVVQEYVREWKQQKWK
ncbi:hypothetical protein CIHG_05290 [Coccidioides immitis H538.4]|uniref:Pleiotropic ABC efflux transporter N-terminal domain-containing protein n=1 Tax=Coccidioides immitis H538.4 TaxID=396776 RepID=A0A0J8RU06_COCIT|nr:hypothetical protein CIHG_05290 [Coccidioides immitis H538.4]TPX20571.1 hypothetical protein DIZ76_016463 [Coccidioides immitis]